MQMHNMPMLDAYFQRPPGARGSGLGSGLGPEDLWCIYAICTTDAYKKLYVEYLDQAKLVMMLFANVRSVCSISLMIA